MSSFSLHYLHPLFLPDLLDLFFCGFSYPPPFFSSFVSIAKFFNLGHVLLRLDVNR